MPRARLIKYDFFRNDVLGHMPLIARLLFAGLWTLADREGRIKDNPGRILVDLFPYDTAVLGEREIDEHLEALHNHDLLTRYEVDGVAIIQITTWLKHQRPHPKEASSTLPPPPANARQERVQHPGATLGEPGLTQGEQLTPFPSFPSMPSFPSFPSFPSGASPQAASRGSDAIAREKENSRAKKGTRLPDDWQLPKAWENWAIAELDWSRAQITDQAARFADHYRAVTGQKAIKLDWLATWRNWCRNARDYARRRNANGASTAADRYDELRVVSERHGAEWLAQDGAKNAPDDPQIIDMEP